MTRLASEDPNFFAHKGQPQVRRADVNVPYIAVQAAIFSYVGKEPKPQGQFTVALLSGVGATTFTISRPGSKPLLTFTVTKALSWVLSNRIYVNFNDSRGVPWLLRFANPAAAAAMTAVIACLMSVQSMKEIANFEASPGALGRGISINDRIQISYWAFSFGVYPSINERPVSSKELLSTVLARDKLSTGWVSGLVGMISGTTRVVFIPAQYTAFENGSRDPGFPNTNLIVVTTLHRVKFFDETHSAVSEASESDLPVPEAFAMSPSLPDSDLERADFAADAAPESDDSKIHTLERIRRRGGVAGAFATPLPRSSGAEASRSRASEHVRSAGSTVSPTSGSLDERLDALERSINAKLEFLIGTSEAQRIVGIVTGLAAQVRQKQQEIEELKREIDSERAQTAAPVPAATLEQMRRELEAIRSANAALERQASESDARVQGLERRLGECADAAKGREKTLIKRMMDDVFQETTAEFEDRRQYSGAEVGDKLRAMLRKHSKAKFDDINANGLF
jgi:predicted  nucleic acid-binding Zn-ribbon protein